MEERSLVRQLLEAECDDGPTLGERRGFGQVPWGWLDMILVAAAGLVLNLGVVPVGGLGAYLPGGAGSFFVEVVAAYLLLLGLLWIVGLRRHRVGWAELGFRPTDLRSLTGLLLFLACTIVAANMVVGLFVRLPEPRDLFVFGREPAHIAIMALLVLLAAPLAEEIFFRGFLLQGLARRLTFWPAAIISSALFALAHVWWQFYLPVFVLGLAFAWLFWRTGSLWAAIAAHATINGTSFAVVLLLGR